MTFEWTAADEAGLSGLEAAYTSGIPGSVSWACARLRAALAELQRRDAMRDPKLPIARWEAPAGSATPEGYVFAATPPTPAPVASAKLQEWSENDGVARYSVGCLAMSNHAICNGCSCECHVGTPAAGLCSRKHSVSGAPCIYSEGHAQEHEYPAPAPAAGPTDASAIAPPMDWVPPCPRGHDWCVKGNYCSWCRCG